MNRPNCLRGAIMLVAFAAVLGGTAGCTSTPTVQAWQKGYLARADMAMEGNALEAKFADHTYFSKEAASGGAGVAGGGCGCN